MKKHSGKYKALVIDNNDPLNSGRVKIRVKGMMDGVPDSHLPWAKYDSQTFVGKGGADFRPIVGSKVGVRFADGDINDAYFSGGVVENKADLPVNSEKGRYILYETPDKRVVITANDNINDIEVKAGDYNTTLTKIIEAVFGHGHSYVTPNALTSKPSLVPTDLPTPSDAVLPVTFKTGLLR